MKSQVRGIIQVTDRYKEYDVVLRNQCPGAVYWTMCIERLDPWSHTIIESHKPAGRVDAEKKARVNLQMKNTPDASGQQNLIQEFYVSVGYAIEPPAKARCVAVSCEAKKKEVRKRIAAHQASWKRARQELGTRLETECPEGGWEAVREECRARLIATSEEEMAVYQEQADALAAELAAVDPENCAVYGGESASES